jgi:hypothetical protein
MLGHTSLTAVTGLPESVSELLLCRGRSGQQLLNPGHHAKRRGVPEPVDSRTAFDQQTGHSPAAVPDRIIERGAATD